MKQKISSPGKDSGIRYLPLFSKIKGSTTIEASALLPLIVALFWFWIRFFEVMSFQLELQYQLQNAVTHAAYTASFLENTQDNPRWMPLLSAGVASLVLDPIEDSYWESSMIRRGRWGMNCFVHEKTEALRISYNYRIQFPLLESLIQFPVRQTTYQKYYDGESVHDAKNIEYVYITKTGEVYHTQRNCSSIKRLLSYCLREELKEARSMDGSIYYPCEICGDQKMDGYYIAEYGTRYHSSLQCPNVQRKVYIVPKSSVADRNECRNCRKEKI